MGYKFDLKWSSTAYGPNTEKIPNYCESGRWVSNTILYIPTDLQYEITSLSNITTLYLCTWEGIKSLCYIFFFIHKDLFIYFLKKRVCQSHHNYHWGFIKKSIDPVIKLSRSSSLEDTKRNCREQENGNV